MELSYISLSQKCRVSAAFLPRFRRVALRHFCGGYAALLRHFCDTFATAYHKLFGTFQHINYVFATLRLFDDGVAHVQGHHDSAEGHVINVQVLDDAAPKKASMSNVIV